MKDEGVKKHNKALIWVKMPKTGQASAQLDGSGFAKIEGLDPGYADAPYCVVLGLHDHRSGLIQYGTLSTFEPNDFCFAEVQETGLFDINLKVQKLHDQEVILRWWAFREMPTIDSTITPSPGPIEDVIGLKEVDFGKYDPRGKLLKDVAGMDPEFISALEEHGIGSLPKLASAKIKDIADILEQSEVRAIGLIYGARQLLAEPESES